MTRVTVPDYNATDDEIVAYVETHQSHLIGLPRIRIQLGTSLPDQPNAAELVMDFESAQYRVKRRFRAG